MFTCSETLDVFSDILLFHTENWIIIFGARIEYTSATNNLKKVSHPYGSANFVMEFIFLQNNCEAF